MNQANPVAGNPSETMANAIVAVHAFLMAYPLFAGSFQIPTESLPSSCSSGQRCIGGRTMGNAS